MAEAEDSELDAFIEEVVEARLAGRTVDVDAYLKTHPERREGLQRRLDALADIDVCFEALRSTSSPGPEPRETPLEELRVPGFRPITRLGGGGMGSVFLAEQSPLRRLVALKVLSPAAIGDAKASARFQREAETIARLRHPGIVPIHQSQSGAGLSYLCLEFLPGLDLAGVISALKEGGPPTTAKPVLAALKARLVQIETSADGAPWPAVDEPAASVWEVPYHRFCAQVAADCAAALHYAHSQGVVHRDIKPSNIIRHCLAGPA